MNEKKKTALSEAPTRCKCPRCCVGWLSQSPKGKKKKEKKNVDCFFRPVFSFSPHEMLREQQRRKNGSKRKGKKKKERQENCCRCQRNALVRRTHSDF